MQHGPPQPAANAAAAAWIAPRLANQFGAVGRTIPTGFDAYARILHPADPGAAAPVRWVDVAGSNERIMHPLAQFERISTAPGAPRSTETTEVEPPSLGDLEPADLATLCGILQRHTAPAQRCWFAVWEGWGDVHPGTVVSLAAGRAPGPPRPVPQQWQLDLHAARLELAGRTYHLFTGPLDDARRIGSWVTEDWFEPRSPNLFWPDDRRWCVATEVDFDSTLVGGPRNLINDILHSKDLEAWPIEPLDSLASNGDTINPP